MKAKGLAVFCIAMLVACTGAFAGTATFSGSDGDVDAPLVGLGVTYQACLIRIAPDGFGDLSGVVGTYPNMGLNPTTVTVDLAANSAVAATDYAGVQIDLFDAVNPVSKGNLLATVDANSVDLYYTPAIGAQEVLITAAAAGVQTLVVDVTATTLDLSYDTGAGLQAAGSIDLADFGSNNVDAIAAGAEFRSVFSIVTNVSGPAWYFNQVTWTGDAIADLNAGGTPCDAVIVPDVVGVAQAVAESAIVGANLTVGTVVTVISADVPVGDVVSQSPAGGTAASPGSAVNLVVSAGATGTDSDGDHLPDEWENQYFGNLDQLAYDDPDNDNNHNLEEFKDGTDPTDPFSALPISSTAVLVALALACAGFGAMAVRRRAGEKA